MQKLLILSSNPDRDLNLNREVSDLITAIQRLGNFEIRFGLEACSHQLPELLAEHSPQVVHFCGHGAGEKGLVFQDEDGNKQFVSTEILARIFKTFSTEINCTVLNACDSDCQAEAIVEYVNYVIGMNQPILDKAAYLFSIGFYKGLAAGKMIEQAYEMGCIAIKIWSETNSQSTQSRQYRKAEAEYSEEGGQYALPQLPEHKKPVLRVNSRCLPSHPTGSNPASHILPLSTMPNPPKGFIEYVEREIDRKEYKDYARAAYDNFGQFSAERAASPMKFEFQQRKVLLDKVKQFWIEGFLLPSIQNNSLITLTLEDHPEAIADLSQGIEALSVNLDQSYETVRPTGIYEEIGRGRTLLILGDPGAGKTIALLQLAQRLVKRSEANLSLPIPVVFNLSSWAKDQKRIVDWLIDELREKYQVPKLWSDLWIRQEQLILLLDGLDEVKEEYRNDCVRALNEFIRSFPQTEIAVCSRVRDYEALTERLQISSALCLQPLSSKQMYQVLDKAGGLLQGLKALLERDPELEKFAQTPLILNLMSVAYQGWSAQELVPHLRSNLDRNKHVFNSYIDRRLERGASSHYSKAQVLHWLSWLASRMVQEKQTIFLIEKIQPTWLQNRSEEKAYRIRNFMVSGPGFGLIGGLPLGLLAALNFQSPEGLLFTPAFALIFGLIFGIFTDREVLTGSSKEILPLERFSWSWQRAKSKFSLISAWSVGAGWASFSNGWEFALIGGLVGGVIGTLYGGFGGSQVEQRTVPNQGIRTSWKHSVVIGASVGLILLIFCLITGLSDGMNQMRLSNESNHITNELKNEWSGGMNYESYESNNESNNEITISLINALGSGLFLGLGGGLIAGLKYGGTACIQHFTLRWMLHKKGRVPWNYAQFLDFASDRLLMQKVGGGYLFLHRMLLEHFAEINSNPKLT